MMMQKGHSAKEKGSQTKKGSNDSNNDDHLENDYERWIQWKQVHHYDLGCGAEKIIMMTIIPMFRYKMITTGLLVVMMIKEQNRKIGFKRHHHYHK